MLVVYYAVVDRVLNYFDDPYKSPYNLGVSYAQGGYDSSKLVDVKATAIGSLAVLAGALVLVWFTPKFL